MIHCLWAHHILIRQIDPFCGEVAIKKARDLDHGRELRCGYVLHLLSYKVHNENTEGKSLKGAVDFSAVHIWLPREFVSTRNYLFADAKAGLYAILRHVQKHYSCQKGGSCLEQEEPSPMLYDRIKILVFVQNTNMRSILQHLAVFGSSGLT